MSLAPVDFDPRGDDAAFGYSSASSEGIVKL